MAWNRPSEEKKVEVENRGGQWNVHLKWLVAALIVVLGAAVAAWLLWSDAKRPLSTSTSIATSLIKDVKPAVAVTNAAPKKVRPYDDYDHEKAYRDAEGVLRSKKSGVRLHDPAQRYVPAVPMGDPERAVFKRVSNRCIARLVTFKPSNTGIPDQRDYYSASFQKDFMESLKEPIIIDKEKDSPYVQNVKRATIEAKIEIMDRLSAGEKLGDILTETRNEIKRLSDYRKDIELMVRREIRGNENMTKEDAELYIDAANKMLEKEGLKPVSKSSMLKWNLRVNRKPAPLEANDNPQTTRQK